MTSATLEDVKTALTEQHARVKDLIEAVRGAEPAERQGAFTTLCALLAAHEAAEEECIHAIAKADLTGDEAAIVDERTAEEDEAGSAIAALEQMDASSAQFTSAFEDLASSVVAHAEAEEHVELPKLDGKADEEQFTRMLDALGLVPEMASRATGGSFKERLEAARAEFRSEV
ncbi:MAG TPA: hemerythrin domain-containing protein [Pedococcus sp.]|jgi:hypothetical protein|nr:hemerythrin domain-containing protein [Pedococcus sp.]